MSCHPKARKPRGFQLELDIRVDAIIKYRSVCMITQYCIYMSKIAFYLADLLSVLGQDISNGGAVHFSDPSVSGAVLMEPRCSHLSIVVLILYA